MKTKNETLIEEFALDLEKFEIDKKKIFKHLLDNEGEKGEELAIRFFGEMLVLHYKVIKELPLTHVQAKVIIKAMDFLE